MEIEKKSVIPGSWIDLINTVAVKIYNGHTMGEVLTLSMTLEQMVDELLVELMCIQTDWAQELMSTRVICFVHQDKKAAMLRDALIHSEFDETSAIAACKAVANVWELRNKLAHTVMATTGLGSEGFEYAGYRRGEEKSYRISPAEVAAIVDAGNEALSTLYSFGRNR